MREKNPDDIVQVLESYRESNSLGKLTVRQRGRTNRKKDRHTDSQPQGFSICDNKGTVASLRSKTRALKP